MWRIRIGYYDVRHWDIMVWDWELGIEIADWNWDWGLRWKIGCYNEWVLETGL